MGLPGKHGRGDCAHHDVALFKAGTQSSRHTDGAALMTPVDMLWGIAGSSNHAVISPTTKGRQPA